MRGVFLLLILGIASTKGQYGTRLKPLLSPSFVAKQKLSLASVQHAPEGSSAIAISSVGTGSLPLDSYNYPIQEHVPSVHLPLPVVPPKAELPIVPAQEEQSVYHSNNYQQPEFVPPVMSQLPIVPPKAELPIVPAQEEQSVYHSNNYQQPESILPVMSPLPIVPPKEQLQVKEEQIKDYSDYQQKEYVPPVKSPLPVVQKVEPLPVVPVKEEQIRDHSTDYQQPEYTPSVKAPTKSVFVPPSKVAYGGVKTPVRVNTPAPLPSHAIKSPVYNPPTKSTYNYIPEVKSPPRVKPIATYVDQRLQEFPVKSPPVKTPVISAPIKQIKPKGY